MLKKMMKTLCLLVAVTMLFGVALVGCGKSSEPAKDDATAQAASQVPDQTADEKKEPAAITYSTFRYEDEAIFKELIEKFQKENPEITVKFETNKDTNAYYTTLKANLQSGQAADVFDVHPGNDFFTFAKEGVISDLSAMDFITNYQDGPKALTTVDGKVFGYNHAVNLITGIYNKEIFSQNGWTEPKDWNEFVALVGKVKAAGFGGISYLGADVKAVWLTNMLLNQEMGAAEFKAFMEGIDSGDITNVKDNAKAYTVLKTLSEINKNKLLYDNSESVKYPQALSLFAQKKAAIMIMGTWTFGTRDTDYPGIDVGIFPVPTLDKSNVYYAEPAQISCINASGKYQEAAQKWVNFLATAENASVYISKAKMTPTIKGVKADFPGADLLSAAMEKGVNVMPVVSIPKTEFYSSAYNAMIENILFKGADVDQEVATFEAALKKADLKNKK